MDNRAFLPSKTAQHCLLFPKEQRNVILHILFFFVLELKIGWSCLTGSILLAIKQHVEHCWKSLHHTLSLSEKLLYWLPKLRLPIIFPVKAGFTVTFCKGKPWGSFQWAIEQVLCTFSFLSLSTGADSSNGLTRCHPDISGCVPVTFCGYWGVIQFQGNLRLIYPFDAALLL